MGINKKVESIPTQVKHLENSFFKKICFAKNSLEDNSQHCIILDAMNLNLQLEYLAVVMRQRNHIH